MVNRTQIISGGIGTCKVVTDDFTRVFTQEDQTDSFHIKTDGGGHDLPWGVLHVTNPVISGSFSIPGRTDIFSNFIPGYFSGIGYNAPVDDPARPSNSYLATQLLSQTNPSGSVVDIPVSIAELRELPDLVRRFGNNILERIASGNLKYQFGIKPMIGDINALLNFQSLTDNRFALLKSNTRAPMLRKSQLYSSSVNSSSGLMTLNGNPTIYGELTSITTSRQVWGYATWSPSSALQKAPISDDRLRQLARRAVYGMSIDAYTAWNLIPWSWLADWFGNVGDFLSSQRRVVDINPSTPSICESSVTIENFKCSSATIENLTITRTSTRKSRAKASGSLPSAYLPLLTGRQVGILSSLAALRWR